MKIHVDSLNGLDGILLTFPTSLMSEEIAQMNHGQTLERLDERGGMEPREVIANLFRLKLKWVRENPNSDEQLDLLKRIIEVVGVEGDG